MVSVLNNANLRDNEIVIVWFLIDRIVLKPPLLHSLRGLDSYLSGMPWSSWPPPPPRIVTPSISAGNCPGQMSAPTWKGEPWRRPSRHVGSGVRATWQKANNPPLSEGERVCRAYRSDKECDTCLKQRAKLTDIEMGQIKRRKNTILHSTNWSTFSVVSWWWHESLLFPSAEKNVGNKENNTLSSD